VELAVGAEKGQIVLSPALALEFAGARQEPPRLADEVQGEVRQGDVFFEDRAMAAPFP
jgi:hypothetical protein